MSKIVTLIACEASYKDELTEVLSKWKKDTEGPEEKTIKLKNAVAKGILIANGSQVQFQVHNIQPK